MNYRKKVILVDVDRTLTKECCWSAKECLNATPNLKIIKKVNKIAREGYVVIWTARRDFLIPATLEWLRRNGVSFQAISNNKSSGDMLIDDLAVHPKNLL